MADEKSPLEEHNCNAPGAAAAAAAADCEDVLSSSKSVNSSPAQQPPLLKRVETLELSMQSLEERFSPRSVVDGGFCLSLSAVSGGSTRSSCLSTPSSAVDQRRKPIDDVLEETEEKGSLMERVASLEERLESLNMQAVRGDWTPTQVPLLRPPPAKVAKNVAAVAPSDFSAGSQEEDDHHRKQQQQQKKKHHAKFSYMLRNCLHPSN